MFDLQQYEQPPADIIRDLAPGLKFDENGLPVMPNMGAGMMPEEGFPSGQLPDFAKLQTSLDSGQCSVM
jgi:hypothetical protein